jgi:predicted RNA-binding protein YlxR (DUF448 family)
MTGSGATGPHTAAHVPERRCLGCGRRAPKRELARFVAAPAAGGRAGRALHRDDGGRLGGRGLYVCPRRDCFDRAARRRAFQRGARLEGCALEIDLALGAALERGG